MSNISTITISDREASGRYRYKIKQQLSHKAGRKTLLALDLLTHRQVIIKILQFDSLFQWDDLKLFEREANTLKNINHPQIPQFLDYVEIDDDNWRGFALVQTYIDAPSLETAIDRDRKFSKVIKNSLLSNSTVNTFKIIL